MCIISLGSRSCVVVQGDSATASLEAVASAGVGSPDRISSGGSDNDEADTYVVFYGGVWDHVATAAYHSHAPMQA